MQAVFTNGENVNLLLIGVSLYEEWKTLIYQGKRYDAFEVSNLGNLRNVKTGTVYKQHKNKNGYMQVCVSLESKKKKAFKMHKAVAETFIDNVDCKPQVNHIDGNKINNVVSNLEWVTPKENTRHAHDNLLARPLRGYNHPSSKLSKDDIEYIRKNYKYRDKEFGCNALARKFNVDHMQISRIVNNKSYLTV